MVEWCSVPIYAENRGVFRVGHWDMSPLGAEGALPPRSAPLDGSKAPESPSIQKGADKQLSAAAPSLGRSSEGIIDS